MIAGFQEITSGKAQIGGQDTTNEAHAKRGMAMVFQN